MSISRVLERLYTLDTFSPYFSRDLYWVIKTDEREQYLASLQGPELSRLVDFLYGALGVPTISEVTRKTCLHKLQAICGYHRTLPSPCLVSGDLAQVGGHPATSGELSDVWEGTYHNSRVCIKHLRLTEKNIEITEAFYKEAIIWARLKHPNLVCFIGGTRGPLRLVSEWIPNGTITKYVNKNPDANRISLLIDVAEGLAYLHKVHVVHADLKGPNILIDHTGHARLANFGFTPIARGLNPVFVSTVQGHTQQWTPPEVTGKVNRYTKEADIFAFAMVVVEVFAGKPPFDGIPGDDVTRRIKGGERPGRPVHPNLTDSIWKLTCDCWNQDPALRRTASKATLALHISWGECGFMNDLLARTPSVST